MYDAVLQAAGFRAPVVMANVNRETPGILAVSSGQQDMIQTRDAGWIQVIVENSQEILDTIIMAFRLAEDYDIQLPVMVNYDGFYISYLAEGVRIPAKEDVDQFLAVLKTQPKRTNHGSHPSDRRRFTRLMTEFMELRYKHCAALDRAKKKFDEIDKDYGISSGAVTAARLKNTARKTLICHPDLRSAVGTSRTVVDAKRAEGVKVGLIKLRMFRPFRRKN